MKQENATHMTMLVFLAFLLSTGRVAAQQDRIYNPDFKLGVPFAGNAGN